MPVNLLQQTKPITYAIDAWSASQAEKTGVEMYAFELIQAMKQRALSQNERVVLYTPVKLTGPLAELPTGWEEKVISWKTKEKGGWPVGWMQGRMSVELALNPPSVFFVPSQGLSRRAMFRQYPIVTTIHDLGFLRMPDLYDSSSRRQLESITKRSVHGAEKLLTVSEFSKSELIDLLHVPPERITVTPLSADTSVFKRLPQTDIESVLAKYRLGHNFFLFVGRMDKKKNVETVIRAFEEFKTGRGVGDPFELVLVGGPGYGYDFMEKMIMLLPHKSDLRVLGYIPDADVAALMNVATAFLFPSWYEGFGIPNLEAFACGTALITSDIPAHHEVCGQAALFVPPENPSAWVRAMRQLVDNAELKQQLIQAGSARVIQFSWDKTAEKTWEVLRNVV